LTNKLRGNVSHFDVSFKCKKGMRQVFHVNREAFDPETQIIFKRRAGGGRLRVRKRDIHKVLEGQGVTGDFVIQLVRPGHWYMCLPKVRNADPKRDPPIFSNPTYHSAFLDPGVRTFQTFYSPDGVVGKIGERYWKVLEPMALEVDRLQARKATVGSVHARRLHRRCRGLWHRIRCKVDDLHAKACHFLCTMFQVVFIPAFDAGRMSQLPGRKISCKTTRAMMALSHGRFLQRLKAFAKTKHRSVIVVPEEYTTKTCDACGTINPNVGGSETFKCPECGHAADRDIHAARNIALSTIEILVRKERYAAAAAV
jgi:putative transposase